MHYNNWYYYNVMVYMVNDISTYVSSFASKGCYFCNIPPLIVCLYHPIFYSCGTNVIPPMCANLCLYP